MSVANIFNSKFSFTDDRVVYNTTVYVVLYVNDVEITDYHTEIPKYLITLILIL